MPTHATEISVDQKVRRDGKNHYSLSVKKHKQYFSKSFTKKPKVFISINEAGYDYKKLKVKKDFFEIEFTDNSGNPVNYTGEWEWMAIPNEDL